MLLSALFLAATALAQSAPAPAASSSGPPQVHLPWVINPRDSPGLCVDVRSAQWRDGTPVQLWECNHSVAQIVMNGTTIPQFTPMPIDWPAGWPPAGWQPGDPFSGWCLDAGTDPHNGSKVKIWTCYPGLKQQTWEWTGAHWRIVGTNLCLDVTNGGFWGGNQLQVWTCDKNNRNQAWVNKRTQW